MTDAISNETLAPAETVTDGDTVVYAVDATGLAGYTSVRAPTLATGSDLDRLAGLEFAVSNATDPGSNATLANGTTVLPHETGLFLVANASETLGGTVAATGETDLAATFDVVDDRLRAAAGPNASHAHSVAFTYARNAAEPGDTTDGEVDDGGTGSSGKTDDGRGTDGSEGSTDSDGSTDPDGSGSESTTEGTESLDGTDGSGDDVSADGGTGDTGETTGTTDPGEETDDTGDTPTAGTDPTDGETVDDGTVTNEESIADTDSDADGDALDPDGSESVDSGGTGGTDADDGGGGGGTGDDGSSSGGGGSDGSGGGGGGTGGGGGGTGGGGGSGSSNGGGGNAGSDDGDRSDSGGEPAKESAGGGESGPSDPGGRASGVEDAVDGPESRPNPADDGVGTRRLDPSRATAIRAAEERALRDRRELGPRPVADPNAPEEAEYVSRFPAIERASSLGPSAEASGHDGAPTDAPAIEGGDAAGSSAPDGDRPARPPTFEEAPLRSTAYDVPGFGVDAALFALVAAILLARRRRER
ncbi:PGF-CTERM sorting domain-containing protein [Halorubrum aethiopicum]|uniref:PGF-CTERM sorting domain-containing protein n=1 Tax=Halorubrum aethiopicum TaxID=1758255 RepID=UPI0012FECA43|nr:PGF-CTERM sorting domain-containing protein [Halorubrum aethiopicum]